MSMVQETCRTLGQVSLKLPHWKKTSRWIYVVRDGQNSETRWETMPSWMKSRSGPMKSSILKTHENCAESFSLTRGVKNSKNPSRMLVQNGNSNCSCYALKNDEKEVSEWWIQQNLKQDLRVFWKLVNLQDCVWEISVSNYYEDHIAGNRDNSLQHYNLVYKFILMCQSYESSNSKSKSGQRIGKIGENFRVETDESQK